MTMPAQRKTVLELTIEPGTGKALELRKGQVLRIEQTGGRQCADFNCFNLHTTRNSSIPDGPGICTARIQPKVISFGQRRRGNGR
jgi:uncharacterized protein YcgI (DUF1989 family)